jgi:hypothetical protein
MKITMRLTGLVPGFYFNDSFCRKETLNQVMEGVLRLFFFFGVNQLKSVQLFFLHVML